LLRVGGKEGAAAVAKRLLLNPEKASGGAPARWLYLAGAEGNPALRGIASKTLRRRERPAGSRFQRPFAYSGRSPAPHGVPPEAFRELEALRRF